MKFDLIRNSFGGKKNSDVMDRLERIDCIFGSDQFLIGLSEKAPRLEQVFYPVANDIVIGCQLYSSQTKPVGYNGPFRYFSTEIYQASNMFDSINRRRGWKYLEKMNIWIAGRKREFKVDEEINKLLKNRIVDLDLRRYWLGLNALQMFEEPELEVDHMFDVLSWMLQNYLWYILKYIFLCPKGSVALVETLMSHLELGGISCGWVSDEPAWDLTSLKKSGKTPFITDGVIADPKDKLAMLYLGESENIIC